MVRSEGGSQGGMEAGSQEEGEGREREKSLLTIKK
jgi:hypothetical protein